MLDLGNDTRYGCLNYTPYQPSLYNGKGEVLENNEETDAVKQSEIKIDLGECKVMAAGKMRNNTTARAGLPFVKGER